MLSYAWPVLESWTSLGGGLFASDASAIEAEQCMACQGKLAVWSLSSANQGDWPSRRCPSRHHEACAFFFDCLELPVI